MSLRDAIQREMEPKPRTCKLARIVDSMDDDDRAAFAELAGKINSAALTRALNDAGYEVSTAAVYKHQKRECPCDG